MAGILTHDDLIARGKKWLTASHSNKKYNFYLSSMGVILTEFKCYAPSIPDVIGFNHFQTAVLECKVSRADLMTDFRKGHRRQAQQLGNYRFYLVTPNIATENDIPSGWGLLVCQSDHIDIIKPAVRHEDMLVRPAEYSLLYSLARRAELRGLIPDLVKPLETIK